MSRHRHFCFTLNNYTSEDEEKLCALIEHVKYIVWGYEVSPTTGTPHLQGFVSYTNARTLAAVRAKIRGHVEAARGTPEEASTYCKKEGIFFEAGEVPIHSDPGGRERERWDSIRAMAERGDLANVPSDILIRYVSNLGRIRAVWLAQNCPPTLPQLQNYWCHGETGTGKSRSIRDTCGARGLGIYLKEASKWWDGYNGEPVVLIEEFGPEHSALLGGLLKIWCDHYPFRCEVKGGSLLIRPRHIVITSNWDMLTVFSMNGVLAPLQRRIMTVNYDEGESFSDTFGQ